MKKFLFALISLCVLALMSLYVFEEHFKYSNVDKGELFHSRYISSDSKLSIPVSRQFPATDKIREFSLSFEFRPDSFGGYPNLFQTAPVNDGLRMEFGADSALAIIAGKNEQGGLRGIVVSPSVSTSAFHKVEITQHPESGFRVSLDGMTSVSLPAESMRWELSNVTVGKGFDSSRAFKGEIRNFKMNYMAGRARPTLVARHFKATLFFLFCLALVLSALVLYSPLGEKETDIKRFLSLSGKGIAFTAALLILVFFTFRSHLIYSHIARGKVSVSHFNSSDSKLSVPVSRQFPATDKIREFSLSFEFRPDSFGGYPNLFQTAPVNDGLRMEFGADSSLVIIAGKDERGGLRGIVVSPSVSTSAFHKVEITQSAGQDFRLVFDGKTAVSLPAESMRWELSNVTVGKGFDSNRAFKGEMRDFRMKHMAGADRYPLVARQSKKILAGLTGILAFGLALVALSKLDVSGALSRRFFKTSCIFAGFFLLAIFASIRIFEKRFIYAGIKHGDIAVSHFNSSDSKLSVPVSRQFPATDKTREFSLSFEFRPDSFGGYPNLFQTAPVNDGLRMEFGADSSLVIIAGKDEQGGIRGIIVSPSVSTSAFHKVEITQHQESGFRVSLDGMTSVRLPSESMRWELSNVTVGKGFDSNRAFKGEIRDFRMSYMSGTPRPGFSSGKLNKLSFALLALSGIVFFLAFMDRIAGLTKNAIRFLLSPEHSRALFLAGATAFVFHVMLMLSGSFDLDHLKYGTILEVQHPPVSVFDARKSAAHPVFNNPAAGAANDIKEAEFEFDFSAKSFDGFPNLFQTAPYNKGIRMEFGPTGQLALLASRGVGNAIEGRPLDYQISTGTWHHVVMKVSPERDITVQIDNRKDAISPLKADDINLDFSQIMAGAGFDKTRAFNGDVKNFTVKYRILKEHKRLYPVVKILLFILKTLLALLPLFVLWYFSWGPGSMSRAGEPGTAWPQTLAALLLAVLATLSSVKYLFVWLEPSRMGLLSRLLPDLASVKFFTILPNIRDPQFYIWGLPLLAISALVLFLARRDRIAVGAFVSAVVIFLLAAASQLTAGLTALLLMGASYGIGRYICAMLGADGHKDGFILPFAMGLSFNGIAFWIAAHFKVNYPVTHLYFLLCEALLSYKPLRQLLENAIRERRQELSAGQLSILCFAILALPIALTPMIGWDGHIAHVYIAKQTALFGYFDFSPFYPYGLDQAIIPKGLYSPLFMLGELAGIKVFVWFLFMLLFLALEKFTRERFGVLTAFFTALICVLTPSVLWQMQFVFIDVFEFAFGVALLVHAFNTFEDRSWKNLLLFFALSALSYYGKQSNVIIVIPLTMALAIMPLTRLIRERDFLPAGKFLAASLLCPAILAPSFWLNYHLTGNPMFQYFNSVFKSFYFPVTFAALIPAPFIDPWRLIADISFHGAKHCYYGFFNQAFGTWFYVLLPVSLWVLLFDRRNARETFRLAAVFFMAALLFLYLIPPQIRYFDSALPAGALLLALGTAQLLAMAESGWRRWTTIAVLTGLSIINLISTFQYPPLGVMPYPLRAIILKEPIGRPAFEPPQAREIMDYAARVYGKHSKCLLYYSPLTSLANFHVEVYDWYNYRLGMELSSTPKPDVLYDIIFRIKKFDFIILTDLRPGTNLEQLIIHGLIVPEYRIPGYTLYKPAGHKKKQTGKPKNPPR